MSIPSLRTARILDARTVLAAGTAVALLALVLSIAGLVADPRMIGGVPAWLKPMKFAVSITAYLVTIRWLMGLLPRRRLVGIASLALVTAFTAELALIVLQVVRGTTSHFNESTPLDTAVYWSMGGLVGLIFGATVAIAVLALRRRGLDAGAAAGIRWGLAICLLGMAAAGLMIANRGWSPTGGHTVGAPDGGPGLPLTDWSIDHGDLRIAHFVGLHALQLLPLAAWALARFTPLPAPVRARLLAVLGLASGLAVLLLAWQAERGQPLLRPDLLTLAGATAVALVLISGTGGVLLTARRRRVGVPSLGISVG
jgi:hypothetical protein